MQNTNIYQFKVSHYGERQVKTWIPPIEAKTYVQALDKVYSDETVESVTLLFIILPDETQVSSPLNPTDYDIRE